MSSDCPKEKFGLNCSQTCQKCLNGGECDQYEGGCNCTAGFTGATCKNSRELISFISHDYNKFFFLLKSARPVFGVLIVLKSVLSVTTKWTATFERVNVVAHLVLWATPAQSAVLMGIMVSSAGINALAEVPILSLVDPVDRMVTAYVSLDGLEERMDLAANVSICC